MVEHCLAFVPDPIFSNLSEERSTLHFLRLIDGYHAGCPSTGNHVWHILQDMCMFVAINPPGCPWHTDESSIRNSG